MQITERVRHSDVVLVITAAVLFYMALTEIIADLLNLAHRSKPLRTPLGLIAQQPAE